LVPALTAVNTTSVAGREEARLHQMSNIVERKQHPTLALRAHHRDGSIGGGEEIVVRDAEQRRQIRIDRASVAYNQYTLAWMNRDDAIHGGGKSHAQQLGRLGSSNAFPASSADRDVRDFAQARPQ